MAKVTPTGSRKSDHIKINLEEQVDSSLSTGFEKYRFIHEALPELNLEEIDLSQVLFGKTLQAPLLISSMTGGTDEAGQINRKLALAAQSMGVAMGVGSQRAAIEDPTLAVTFQIRDAAPDVLLFANLGAVQLNYGYGVDECRAAVDMLEADALVLHLNSMQEALQPEGDSNFNGLLARIAQVVKQIEVPVIAKEVGWGFSGQTARRLADIGVGAIDIAGAGGTSWSQVEMYRAKNEQQARIAAQFLGWGIPTSESIQLVKQAVPEMIVFSSGGLRSGIDIAKSIALGASLGGMAGPFLKAAVESQDKAEEVIQEIILVLRAVMFGVGAADLKDLQNTPLTEF